MQIVYDVLYYFSSINLNKGIKYVPNSLRQSPFLLYTSVNKDISVNGGQR